ncbi:HAMP domain-containing histidine kinase [Sphingomonas sp. NSE70-1]|uniref:histidine kinase n=1 Tax=Sphingomonas caseinilyticus TaxID=2908205 RepID=A0ABT0RRY7_9SPHN|nr:HAMP domain-containing sensor histidine kinase [Sphingomonas caseinilyticus]MCL6697764.1 HAMP domain-containing histidine kinase [Sphingomonas caseinilyticus]
MASVPSDLGPVSGRVDRDGRLVEADAPLLKLQQEAGSKLGAPLALPQLAAVARSAIKLGVPLSRAVIAASSDQDIDLWVRAEPDAEGARLTIEGWKSRPPAPPRLTLVGSEPLPDEDEGSEALSFTTDAELKITRMGETLAERLGIDAASAVGDPLTRHFLLSDDGHGMPLLSAIAARRDFTGQRAKLRGKNDIELTLEGVALVTSSGLGGYEIEVAVDGDDRHHGGLAIDASLDEALRSPLDRIIAAAERIVDRSEGPLRSDYAAYAGDIAAAGRHLLSVVHSITDQQAPASSAQLNLVDCATEAMQLVHPRAEERSIHLERVGADEALTASGEPRGVVQILVNLLNNAVRHSPEGATVAVIAERRGDSVAVTVADEGPGVAEADQERIFERYERADTSPEGSGLGLAISRRLARSMGGDIELVSTPGQGARFTLVLPGA